MNRFHLHAEKEQGETRGPRTWLVIAGSLFEAMSTVPEGIAGKAVEVQVDTVSGPRRVIRSMDSPSIH